MINNRAFTRKIIYFCAIAVLLVPLSYISRPATTSSEGGVLAQMQRDHNLSHASLGEIDPAGATMSLATLGLRGFAVNQLWMYANRCKMKDNFDGLKTATTQITKLQPNFLAVWSFQAHNLSYNVSVEFDDYRHRYHWVKKGIDYLIEGTRYNRDQPKLLAEVGWFIMHKFGKSDERVQFRRLFREDTDFHQFFEDETNVDLTEALGPDQRPDTWLVSHLWYRRAQETVDTKDVPVTGQSPLIFHQWPARTLMDYANAIEEEGYLDEKGQEAWRVGGMAWHAFGDRAIPTARGFDVRLNDLERAASWEEAAWAKLEELAPGLRKRLEGEKREKLPDHLRAALDKPASDRTQEERAMATHAMDLIRVSQHEFVRHAPSDVRRAVRRWVERAEHEKQVAQMIDLYRGEVNFDYWQIRCQSEQDDTTLAARKHLLAAGQLLDQTDLLQAKREYELAWENWAEVYRKYPRLVGDVDSDMVLEAIVRYHGLLNQLEEEFPPENFPLRDFVNRRRVEYNELARQAFGRSALGTTISSD